MTECRVCGATAYANGLCSRDYARARRNTPSVVHSLRALSIDEAWSLYVDTSLPGCQEWSGSHDSSGYGTVSIGGRNHKAHRVALERIGVIVEGLFVLHSCDNPPCVNTDHLRVGTHQENINDMTGRGRQSRGLAHPRRVLSDGDVLAILTSGETTLVLAERFSVSRQHICKVRSGKQVPWRRVMGRIHPDDPEMTA